MEAILNTITPFLYQNRYTFTFLGALFEGTNIMLIAGFLYKLGLFKLGKIILILLIGYILNGYLWYAIGYFGGKRILDKWGPYFFLTKERIKKLESYYKKHITKTLIITRVTYGISGCAFMIAGIFKTNHKKFFWCNLIGGIIWVLMMFLIGYSFGISYEAISRIVNIVAIWMFVTLFIVIIIIAMSLVYWLRQKARTRFIENILSHQRWEKIKWLGKKIYEFLNDNV